MRRVRPAPIQGVSPPQVNLLKGSPPRVWAPSLPPQSAPALPPADPLDSDKQENHSWPSENGESVTLGRLLEGQQQNPSGGCYWFIRHRHALCSARPCSPTPFKPLPWLYTLSHVKGPPAAARTYRGPLIHPLPLKHLFQELTAPPRPSHVHREPNGIT